MLHCAAEKDRVHCAMNNPNVVLRAGTTSGAFGGRAYCKRRNFRRRKISYFSVQNLSYRI